MKLLKLLPIPLITLALSVFGQQSIQAAQQVAKLPDGTIIITGLSSSQRIKISYLAIPKSRKMTVNGCGFLRIPNSTAYPTTGGTFAINGGSQTTYASMPQEAALRCIDGNPSRATSTPIFNDADGNVYYNGLTANSSATIQYFHLPATRNVSSDACGIAVAKQGTKWRVSGSEQIKIDDGSPITFTSIDTGDIKPLCSKKGTGNYPLFSANFPPAISLTGLYAFEYLPPGSLDAIRYIGGLTPYGKYTVKNTEKYTEYRDYIPDNCGLVKIDAPAGVAFLGTSGKQGVATGGTQFVWDAANPTPGSAPVCVNVSGTWTINASSDAKKLVNGVPDLAVLWTRSNQIIIYRKNVTDKFPNPVTVRLQGTVTAASTGVAVPATIVGFSGTPYTYRANACGVIEYSGNDLADKKDYVGFNPTAVPRLINEAGTELGTDLLFPSFLVAKGKCVGNTQMWPRP
jgi:hypothetical protein